ncbi:MAG: cytochrome c oxidase subunit 3 [Myxococcota bacterium]|nr:cytochrome c oxidase subunit 3 [Myxococcota bacterium]
MSDQAHPPSGHTEHVLGDDHAHDHGHGHGHGSRFIAHHYDDAQHQFDSGKLGIWLFLAQEVLFFSGLFVAYILYRHHHPEIYAYAHKYLDVKYGAINTGVLIFSSLTAAWAVRAAQLGQRKLLIGCLAATVVCACAFLGIKYVEYDHKIHEQILFGRYFDPCVSSGGTPLLTKKNGCSGHESSVVWDFGTARPLAGCFPDYAIDQDTRKDDIQASCSVSEVKVSYENVPGPNGTVKRVEREAPIRPITEQCAEWVPASRRSATPQQYPCWRPAYQPAVCQLGYSFTWREGDALRFGGPYRSESDCRKDVAAKTAELEKAAPGGAAPTGCVRSNTHGIIVEYGDHATQAADVRVKAECQGPAPVAAPGDPFAEQVQTIELGKKSLQAPQKLTHAEEKEKHYAGPPPEHTSMFFTIYFAMTGLHGIHVLFGIGVFVWLLIRAIKGHFTADYFGPVDFAALYWHIVDLIWIFLFPLLYLIH